MTEDDKLEEQVEILNEAMHRIWFDVMRPNMLSGSLRNLTFLDLHIISTACKNPNVILKDIKDTLHVPHSTLSSSVSKLERIGLIKRVINRRDLRSYSIEVTPEGKEVMAEHERIDAEQAKRVILPLSPAEREEFIALIKKAISGY